MTFEGSYDARPPEKSARREAGSRIDRIGELIPQFLDPDTREEYIGELQQSMQVFRTYAGIETHVFSEEQQKQLVRDYMEVVKPEVASSADVLLALQANSEKFFQTAKKKFLERTQDLLSAYLFATNRESIPTKFDTEKEHRQIQAVVELLSGNHVHMGTGEGKSSVVFPVATIVEALTSREQQAVLSTVNDSLLAELTRHTKRLVRKVQDVFPEHIELERFINREKPIDTFPLAHIKEALLTGTYSKETRTAIRDRYWNQEAEAASQTYTPGLPSINKISTPRILLATDRDLVFANMDDPETFQQRAPVIFMDEAHVPYDRNTPYERTQLQRYLSPDEIQDATFQWILDFMVIEKMRELKLDTLVEFDRGAYRLREDKMPAVERLNLKATTDQDALFRRAATIIADALAASEEERVDLRQSLFTLWQNGLKRRVGMSLKERIRSVAQEVAGLHNEEGISYVFNEERGGVSVRDAYIGQLLKTHRFDPQREILLRAFHQSFQVISLAQKAHRTNRFQSFVAASAEKLRCASGTLLYPDIATHKIQQSPFAVFLKQRTKHDVIEITPPETKQTPSPELFPEDEAAMNALVEHVANTSGSSLVICWHEGEANRLTAKFDKLNKRVGLVGADIPQDEEMRIYRQLADGNLDVVVTSGRSGLGVDIKASNGSFPDLHVAIFGMPQTQLQVVQALGRRRQTGDRFSWFISESALEKGFSHFAANKNVIERFLGATDVASLKTALTSKDDTVRLEMVASVLRRLEKARGIDDEFVVLYDRLMKTVQKQAEILIQKTIKREMTNLDEKHAEWFMEECGIPEFLYWYPMTELLFLPGASTIRDLVENKLAQRLGLIGARMLPKDKETTLLQEWMEGWWDERKKPMEECTSVVWMDGRLQTATRVSFVPASPEVQKSFLAKEGDPHGFGAITLVKRVSRNKMRVVARKDSKGNVSFAVTETPNGLSYLPWVINDFGNRELELVALSDPPESYMLYALTPASA